MDTVDRTDPYIVASVEDLDQIYASPRPEIATKETDYITEVGRAFIEASPFALKRISFVNTSPPSLPITKILRAAGNS